MKKVTKRLLAVVMLACTPWCLGQVQDCLGTGQQFATCATVFDAILSDGGRLTRPDRAYEAGAFEGFVLGVALVELQKTWCPHERFTLKQVSAVTSKFLRSSPEQWGVEPKVLVRMALSEAFPCPVK
jgi:hypothetical protein